MRLEKQSIVKEIQTQLEASNYVLVTAYRGLKVAGFAELRRRLAPEKTRLQVVRNAFLRIAADQCGKGDVMSFVEGPVAIVTGGDVTRVAKVLRTYARENVALKVCGGIFESAPLTPEGVEQLADIPSREVLYSQLVGTLAAPMQQLVGVLSQKLLSIVYVLKAIGEKKQGEAGQQGESDKQGEQTK